MSDTQIEVGAWHRSAVPKATPQTTALKLLEEASEAHAAARDLRLHSDQGNGLAYELADVAIAAYALAELIGADLDFCIHRKLEMLRRRSDQPKRDAERGITP